MQNLSFRIDELISKVYCSRETIEAAIKATSQKDRWDRMEKQLNGGKRLASIFRGGTLQRDRGFSCRLGHPFKRANMHRHISRTDHPFHI